MDTSIFDIVEGLSNLAGPGVMALVIVLLLRGDLATKSAVRSVEDERDHWRKTAEEAIELGFAAIRQASGKSESESDKG